MNARTIFIAFAQRDCGLTAAQAAYEHDNLLTSNGVPLTRAAYIATSRVGAPFAMTRAARLSLHMTFENARNHAAFAADMA